MKTVEVYVDVNVTLQLSRGGEMKTIREVCEAFGLTPRTLRYYEELGLLTPVRTETNQRRYDKKELAKLKLIARGKRFNFTLSEIKEMILLFDVDRTGRAQLERTIEYGQEKMEEIDSMIEELKTIRRELSWLDRTFREKLEELKGGE